MAREIDRLEAILVEDGQLINCFKDRFNICETVYKIALFEHQKSIGKRLEARQLKLDMRQAPSALSFAGYSIDRQLLTKLFGSKSRSGWTAKAIRDALTHGIDQAALRELKEHKEEIFSSMAKFLDCIRED
ncbi:MAG: hypothetical protein IJI12_06115 [Atopobiaceae bacterium]|nr:hypothetical protein [Atopobiaceae bacterium]